MRIEDRGVEYNGNALWHSDEHVGKSPSLGHGAAGLSALLELLEDVNWRVYRWRGR